MASALDEMKSGLTEFGSVNQKVQAYSKNIRSRIADKSDGARDDVKQRDPYVHLRFSIQIGQVDVALFSECSALTIENEVFEYQEGGLNSYTHKLPTRTKYGNVTLKRGLDDSQHLHAWFMQISSGRIKRENLSLVLHDATGKEVRRWDLQNAYPCKWTGPDLRADAGAVAVETVELAHEGLIPRGNPSLAGDRSLIADRVTKLKGYATEALDMADKASGYADEADKMGEGALDAGKSGLSKIKGLF